MALSLKVVYITHFFKLYLVSHLSIRFSCKIEINQEILRVQYTLNMICWLARRHVYMLCLVSTNTVTKSVVHSAASCNTPRDYSFLLYLNPHTSVSLFTMVIYYSTSFQENFQTCLSNHLCLLLDSP